MKLETAAAIGKDLLAKEAEMGMKILAETKDDVKLIHVNPAERFEKLPIYMMLFHIKNVQQYTVLMEAVMTTGKSESKNLDEIRKNGDKRDVLVVMQVDRNGHQMKFYDTMTLQEIQQDSEAEMQSPWTGLFDVPKQFNDYKDIPKEMRNFISNMWNDVYTSVDVRKFEK
jgi:hypothetical protein